jgi:hypothetical protein
VLEKLLGSFAPKVAHGATHTLLVHLCGTLRHTFKNFVLGLGKLIQIVDEIDKQKFHRQRLWKTRLHAKGKPAAAQLKLAMTLVIVDNGLVIELRGTDTETVVGV